MQPCSPFGPLMTKLSSTQGKVASWLLLAPCCSARPRQDVRKEHVPRAHIPVDEASCPCGYGLRLQVGEGPLAQ